MSPSSIADVRTPVLVTSLLNRPDFVEICQYVVDNFVSKYGSDKTVMPMGGQATAAMLHNASAQFKLKGMDWHGYYHQTGSWFSNLFYKNTTLVTN